MSWSKIIQLLTYGEQCGCELPEQMQINQSTLCHHMKTLENSIPGHAINRMPSRYENRQETSCRFVS
ncbi:MAG: helix-turn-helix transcriptional regulator [Clostridia bacterium]|nr:helix-turn-helix transcriptional regulator [Clostridia bacterium]